MKLNAFFIFLLVFVLNCSPALENSGPRYSSVPPPQKERVYVLAVHPLYNPRDLIKIYQPLVDYLNQKLIGEKIHLQTSQDYSSFENKIRNQEPHFLLPNPWQTLLAMKVGYQVVAMAGEASDFKGIFIVRKDSDVRRPSDLKGRSVSYPSPTALAACIMPQYYLHQHGVDVNRDLKNLYVGSQHSSIMNVYLKQVAAGATWPPPWRAFIKEHPLEAAELKVIWETPSLINNSFMIHDVVPEKTRENVRKTLLSLQDSTEGKVILSQLQTARFLPATNQNYDVVKKYVNQFEKSVRKVEFK